MNGGKQIVLTVLVEENRNIKGRNYMAQNVLMVEEGIKDAEYGNEEYVFDVLCVPL